MSVRVGETVVANKFPLKFVLPVLLKVGGVLPTKAIVLDVKLGALTATTPLTAAVRGIWAEFSPMVTVDGTPETAAGPVNTNELILFAGTSTDNVSVAVKVEVTVLLDVLPPDDP
jgi:hypothetical protein